MWGTFLSEPLRIVALVGRYPANQLMRRMTIRSRIAPLIPKGCPSGMLRGIRRNFFRLSPCCGQVSYVLLTRAPVAGRSIATPPLPLDLHVLSLSLAFILSQDQTLRCCLFLFFSFLYTIEPKRFRIDQCLFVLFCFRSRFATVWPAPRLSHSNAG